MLISNRMEDKMHILQKPIFTDNGNAVILQTENNFTQKRGGKTGLKSSYTWKKGK